MANNKAGSRWLHATINKTARERRWGEIERELRRRAEKWEDDGVPFEEVVARVEELRWEMTGGLRRSDVDVASPVEGGAQ